MKKRRTADEVSRLLRGVDRDLANGLTISDVCRKIGVAVTTYYRWRQRNNPAQVDSDRRCREHGGMCWHCNTIVICLVFQDAVNNDRI